MTAPWFDGSAGYTRVFLEEVALNLKIGATEWERHPDKRMKVLATVECFLRQERHEGETLDSVIDYDRLYRLLQDWQERPHTDLLETLAQELADACLTDPRIEACRVALRKPDIYWNAAAAGVEFYRRR
ncbi:dihydroneopterin aldolase [Aquibaculum sediminis]|uniref:dihydroneopterin aldolase n=1 Tax=Aquibaculum sediminis TaxID=3231907 RepID=UPI00345688D7